MNTFFSKTQCFCVALFVLLASFDGIAQIFSYGGKLGVNLNRFGADNGSTTLKPGLAVGFTGTYSNTEECSIGLDLMFSQKGGYWSQSSSNYKSTVNYLEIPLTANVFFNSMGNKIRPRILLGPALGIKLGSSTKNEDLGMELFEKNNFYNRVDFGAVLGAGLNIRIKPLTWISVDARYSMGLTNAINSTSIDLTNNTIGLVLGLNFGLE